MEITPSPTNPTATVRTQANSLVQQNAAEDFDKFLRLMTEQLRHQDPLDPADPTEFVAQLATFSSVEQSIKSNEKLDQLIASTSGLADFSAATLIGKAVESQTGKVEATGRPIPFAYDSTAEATSVVAQVRDGSDRLVREIPLTAGTARQEATWDGRSKDGSVVAAGPYSIEILSYKDKDLLAHAPAISQSKVAEVLLTPAGSQLKLADGSTLPLSQVKAISAGG
jgi:flagellar basal-body rod modification protein FlgD